MLDLLKLRGCCGAKAYRGEGRSHDVRRAKMRLMIAGELVDGHYLLNTICEIKIRFLQFKRQLFER
jgi:hypothetical protein